MHREKLMPPRGYVALPRRWVVERTFAWISHNQRMARDHERLCSTGEAFIHAAIARLMVRLGSCLRIFRRSQKGRSPNFAYMGFSEVNWRGARPG